MARQILYTTVLLLAFWSGAVKAQGFGPASCVSLQPTSGNVQIQNTAEPFVVASPSLTYTPGQPISVFIASFQDSVVASAIFLQARRVGLNAPVGSFTPPAGGLYQSLACGTSPSQVRGTIVSINTNPKPLNLVFEWTPPATAVGNVEFVASLVEDQTNRAWIGVTSTQVQGEQGGPVLTLDNCPSPTVSDAGVVDYQPPFCRRDDVPFSTADCTPLPGTTLPTGVTSLSCTCIDDTTGNTAACLVPVNVTPVQQGCNPSPCLNGGNCIPVPQLPSGFFCNCINGFSGDTCEIGIDPCTPNPCQNGGSCLERGSTFFCECFGGFTGAVCQTGGPAPLTVAPCPPNINNFGSTFVWTPPGCTINGNVVGVAVCNPPSGTTFAGAVNPVTCTCQAGDETATCPFNINAQPAGPACAGNPCGGALQCRELGSARVGYTCHSMTGTPCP